MPNRLIRKSAVFAKIEATSGSDAAPDGTNAILVSNQNCNPLNAQNVDRDLSLPHFGASEMLVGPGNVELSFDVELVGSGTAGAAAPWNALVRACALAQTLTASTRADYTPVSSSLETVTLYYYDDGVLHKLLGAVGEMAVSLRSGSVAKASFRFVGIDGGIAAAALPAASGLSNFKQPQVIFTASSTPITIGATHSASGAPTLTGGTAYPGTGMEFSLGNEIAFNPFLGGETVDITNRMVSGSLTLNLTGAQEASFMSTVKAGTLQSLAMVAGNVANRRVLVHLPSVQLLNPRKEEAQGVRLIGFDFRAIPSAGNDELRLVTSY